MTPQQEKEALVHSLSERVTKARKLSLGYSPNVFILATENEFIQMIGHNILKGDFDQPRYAGFRVKVKE